MTIAPSEAGGPVALGLDIGGTQIRAAAILPTGERLGRRSVTTPLAGGPEAVYSACVDLLNGVMADLEPTARQRVPAIGVSCAGPVNPWRGQVLDPPNIRPLRDAFLADELEARLHLPVYLERDTNVAALGEQWLGAARGCRDFMYVTVSTGLGGAVYTDGRLMLGPDGTAGEIGHVTLIEGTGPRCGCGGVGHLEAISSGSGLAGQARDYLVSAAGRDGASPYLAARAAFAPLTGRDVAEGELAGDPVCVALMERARRAFAIACVGWVNTFNPERIVVGGTVAQRQGERWLGPVRAEIAATGLRSPSARVQVVAAELGEDVGLVGAWPLVRERHGNPIWRSQRTGS
ncbi:MAG TPA: ROK family protein [Candidatus Limnocylindrales bacterium]